MARTVLPSYTQDWNKTTREMVSQTRRWAVTMRGMTLGPWAGLFAHSEVLRTTTSPWFDVVTTTHDQLLDLWEAQVNAALDGASLFTPRDQA